MAGAYFQVVDDFPPRGRWYLNGLRDSAGVRLDSRVFRYGSRVETAPQLCLPSYEGERRVEIVPPLRVSRRREGRPLDFTLADFEVPVVTARVAELIARAGTRDIQRFPVRVDGCEDPYEI